MDSIDRLRLMVDSLFSDNEDVSYLLKAHLFSERLIDEILLDHLGSKAKQIQKLDLRYAQKVSLLSSFGLIPEEGITSLRKLNTLRNKCVHTLNMSPSLDQVKDIIDDFADSLPGIKDETSIRDILTRYMALLCGYLMTKTEMK